MDIDVRYASGVVVDSKVLLVLASGGTISFETSSLSQKVFLQLWQLAPAYESHLQSIHRSLILHRWVSALSPGIRLPEPLTADESKVNPKWLKFISRVAERLPTQRTGRRKESDKSFAARRNNYLDRQLAGIRQKKPPQGKPQVEAENSGGFVVGDAIQENKIKDTMKAIEQEKMGGDKIRSDVALSYSNYVNNNCDGLDNLESRACGWGYNSSFLKKAFTPKEMSQQSFKKLFSSACGGGCPLQLKPADVTLNSACVVDLGCGGGHDAIITSRLVGAQGSVIGIDLTQAMLEKARAELLEFNQQQQGVYAPVSFRQAALDDGSHLKGVVPAQFADMCISNGCFNLTASKADAFASAFRILKPGGYFLLSDVCKVTGG